MGTLTTQALILINFTLLQINKEIEAPSPALWAVDPARSRDQPTGLRKRIVDPHLGMSRTLGWEGPGTLLFKGTFSHIHFLSLCITGESMGPDLWLTPFPWAEPSWGQRLLHGRESSRPLALYSSQFL